MLPGAPRLLSPRLPGRRRARGSLRLRAASGAGSWTTPPRACLPSSTAARRLGTRAWTPPPHTCSRPPKRSRYPLPPGTGSTQGAAAMLFGSCDSVTASAFRFEAPPLASHASARRLQVGCLRPHKAPPPLLTPAFRTSPLACGWGCFVGRLSHALKFSRGRLGA